MISQKPKKTLQVGMFTKLFVLCIITYVSSGNLEIKHLDKDPILVLKLRDCKIQTGTLKIIHPINLRTIEDTITTLIKFTYDRLDTNTSMYKLIENKIKILTDNFYQLNPLTHSRSKRWDTVGKVWKWIAGTPDADDLRLINSTMNQLITNNYDQFHLNEQLNKRMEQMSTAINDLIFESNANNQMLREVQAIKLIIRIDTVNQLVQNIQEAILGIKASLPNNKILSIEELMQIKSFLIKQGIETQYLEEVLLYVKPKMALKDDTLIYILEIPEMEKEQSEILLITSLPVSNKVITQHPKYLIKSPRGLFTTTKPQNTIQKFEFFEKFQDDCITPLITGRKSTCTVKEDTSESATLITDNKVLILNSQNETLYSDCGPDNRTLIGNFLISFDNCNVIFKKTQFEAIEMTVNIQEVQGALYNLNLQEQILATSTLTTIPPVEVHDRKLIDHVYLQQSTHNKWIWSLFGISMFILCGVSTMIFYIFKFRSKVLALIAIILGPSFKETVKQQKLKGVQRTKEKTDEDVSSSPPGGIMGSNMNV